MAAVELVQLLREMLRTILHVTIEIIGLFRVNLEMNDESLLLERAQPIDFDIKQYRDVFLFGRVLSFWNFLQGGLYLQCVEGVCVRFILDREEAAELLAHTNFSERRVEVHRRACADAVISNIAALHHLAELLGVPHDFKTVIRCRLVSLSRNVVFYALLECGMIV